MNPHAPASRTFGALAGIALLGGGLVALWFALLLGVLGVQAPDPFAADGDPCCGTPDDWAETGWAVVGVLVAIALAFLFLAGGCCLLVWAARKRWPRRRWLVLPPAAATGICALGLGVALIPQIGETPERAHCSDFSLRAGDWRSAPPHEKVTLADGIDTCRALHGASMAKARALLGNPNDRGRDDQGQTYWAYDNLNATDDEWDDDGYSLLLRFRNGREVATEGPAGE